MTPNAHRSPDALIVALAGAVLLSIAAPLRAQMGTPPQTFCGKTYVFAPAVPDGTVPAGVASALTVNTSHFMNQLAFSSGCPAPPYTVTMTATLNCDPGPDGGPTIFGPFTIAEGQTIIPISVPVPAGPVRGCELAIVSRVTFGDGQVLEQSNAQPIFVGTPTPGRSEESRLTVTQAITVTNLYKHPGDQLWFTYRATNKDPTHSYLGLARIGSQNVAGLPSLAGGTATTGNGTFATCDPGGGAALPIAFVTDLSDPTNPLQLPDPAHAAGPMEITQYIYLGPGQSLDLNLVSRPWNSIASGAASQFPCRIDGYFSDNQRGSACVSAVGGADRLVAPQHQFADSGRVATMAASSIPGIGPAARMSSALSDGVSGATYLARLGLRTGQMQMLVNGVPVTGSNFSGVTMVEGEWIVVNGELSFVTPQPQPGDSVTMVTPWVLQTDSAVASRFNTTILSCAQVPGAPNGFSDRFPVIRITAFVDDMIGNLDGTLSIEQQLRGIGVENGTFNGVNQRLTALNVQQTGPGSFTTTSTWTQLSPGSTPYVGFDVFGTTRAALTAARRNPLTASGTAAPSPTCIGDPITLKGSASGGTPPYQYFWEVEFSLSEFQIVGTRPVVTHTPAIADPGLLPRRASYRLRVNDAAGSVAVTDRIFVDVTCNRVVEISQESAPGAGDFTTVQTGQAVSTGDDDLRSSVRVIYNWSVAQPFYHAGIGASPLSPNHANAWIAEGSDGRYFVAVLDAPTTTTSRSAQYTVKVSGAGSGVQVAVLDDGPLPQFDDAYTQTTDPGLVTFSASQTWMPGETAGLAVGPLTTDTQIDLEFSGLGGAPPLTAMTVASAHTSGAAALLTLPLQLGRRVRFKVNIPFLTGDMDCSGTRTPADRIPFIQALVDPAGYAASYPNCSIIRADTNGDGVIDGRDIPGFVSELIR